MFQTHGDPFAEVGRSEVLLYTDSLIIRGVVRTRHTRVTDILSLADTAFLVLEDVSMDEFGERSQPVRADYAQVNLELVLFAVANTPVAPTPELRSPKMQERAIISVPPFKVTGTVHLPPSGGNLRDALDELTGRFLPITDATFWSDRLGEARQTALLLAVNHQRAQFLAPYREIDPWAGLGGPATGSAATGPESGAGGVAGSTAPPGDVRPEPPGGGW